ncbi:MAG: aldehyde ferredoxin oxidoreductase family protein [Firmicutes bacterium]|nr:aldehyde ferredoxin oxidoreductase family protein [Bacillota bacterium]
MASGKLYGYGGRILRVDLGTGTARTEPTPESLAREYLGGRGFVAKILWDELPVGVEPFSTANKVVIASGPMAGLFLPGSGKVEMGTKSPATGLYGEGNMGGHLAGELKFAGYDAVIIEGVSPEPCYIFIDDDRVEVRDASKYWGKGAFEAEKMLKEDLGEDFKVATIGPAGENLVVYAVVSHDFGRQVGRTGVGAVLGHKKVKALAVRGSRGFEVADPEGVLKKGKEMYEACFAKPGFDEWTPYGTAGVTDWINEIGAFPTKNFQTGYYERHKAINGQTLKEKICILDKGCTGCPIPCGKYSRFEFGGKTYYVEGPEYETIALMGGNLLLESIEDVAYVNYVADELGIDTISGGSVVAFTLECLEKGVLTSAEVGRELRWGDAEGVAWLLERIAHREGIGDVLALGVKKAAERFGKGSERFAMHVKGLEVSGYESRYAPAMMLAYMTADIGAHHNRAWAITYDAAVGQDKTEGKAWKVIELQHVRPLFDALGLCRLQWVEIGFELSHYADMFPLVTGWKYSWEDLLRISERIWNLTRCFNKREKPDFGRAYDLPPLRWMEEPLPSGAGQGRCMPRDKAEKMLDEYYSLRGWDSNGLPTRGKLEELGLGFVLEKLKLES